MQKSILIVALGVSVLLSASEVSKISLDKKILYGTTLTPLFTTKMQATQLKEAEHKLKKLLDNLNNNPYANSNDLIRKAVVEDGIHPKLIHWKQNEKSVSVLQGVICIACCENKIRNEDLSLIETLLEYGADSCEIGKWDQPVLCSADKIPVAQLLLKHGAHRLIEQGWGGDLLTGVFSPCADPDLITFYTQQYKIDPNSYDKKGYNMLHRLVDVCFFGKYLKQVMRSGCSLAAQIKNEKHYYKGFNTPQLLKSMSESKRSVECSWGDRTPLLSSDPHIVALQAALKEESRKRNDYPTYEELENAPLPGSCVNDQLEEKSDANTYL